MQKLKWNERLDIKELELFDVEGYWLGRKKNKSSSSKKKKKSSPKKKKSLSSKIKNAVKSVGKAVSKATKSVSKAVSKAKKSIGSAIKKTTKSVSKAVSKVTKSVSKAAESGVKDLTKPFSKKNTDIAASDQKIVPNNQATATKTDISLNAESLDDTSKKSGRTSKIISYGDMVGMLKTPVDKEGQENKAGGEKIKEKKADNANNKIVGTFNQLLFKNFKDMVGDLVPPSFGEEEKGEAGNDNKFKLDIFEGIKLANPSIDSPLNINSSKISLEDKIIQNKNYDISKDSVSLSSDPKKFHILGTKITVIQETGIQINEDARDTPISFNVDSSKLSSSIDFNTSNGYSVVISDQGKGTWSSKPVKIGGKEYTLYGDLWSTSFKIVDPDSKIATIIKAEPDNDGLKNAKELETLGASSPYYWGVGAKNEFDKLATVYENNKEKIETLEKIILVVGVVAPPLEGGLALEGALKGALLGGVVYKTFKDEKTPVASNVEFTDNWNRFSGKKVQQVEGKRADSEEKTSVKSRGRITDNWNIANQLKQNAGDYANGSGTSNLRPVDYNKKKETNNNLTSNHGFMSRRVSGGGW